MLAMVYFSSLIFFVIEQKVNPEVKDYNDALWWAFMDVTTVGSNIIAITPTGRILSVLLAALGMMMFPIFTVYVTSLAYNRQTRKKKIIIIKRIPVSLQSKIRSQNRPVRRFPVWLWLAVSSGALYYLCPEHFLRNHTLLSCQIHLHKRTPPVQLPHWKQQNNPHP